MFSCIPMRCHGEQRAFALPTHLSTDSDWALADGMCLSLISASRSFAKPNYTQATSAWTDGFIAGLLDLHNIRPVNVLIQTCVLMDERSPFQKLFRKLPFKMEQYSTMNVIYFNSIWFASVAVLYIHYIINKQNNHLLKHHHHQPEILYSS